MGRRQARASACICYIALVAAPATLAGCPSVDLGDDPPDIGLCNPAKGLDYFTSDIWPMYLHPADPNKDCAKSGCHDMEHGLALDVSTPIDFTANYRVAQGYLNCGTPMASELLTKPLAGAEEHGGGDIFADPSDPAVVDFLAWFQ